MQQKSMSHPSEKRYKLYWLSADKRGEIVAGIYDDMIAAMNFEERFKKALITSCNGYREQQFIEKGEIIIDEYFEVD